MISRLNFLKNYTIEILGKQNGETYYSRLTRAQNYKVKG